MTYEEWIRLPEADKLALPESEYPEIPKDQLRNFLTKAVVKKVKGVIGWETTQEYGTRRQTEWFPEFRQKEVGGVMIWYAFDPTEGTYKPNIEREPSMEEEPIGSYGLAWMHFMEDNYPEWVEVLRFQHRYLTEARKVDESAWEYRFLLDEQYAKANPRPDTGFEANLAWERTRQYYTDSAVMRERVLIPPTVPTEATA
ncbi:MAG: TnpV protein [Oscillospiraceae bacterium]|nr:TnpV protein [Oscillospiraceae bacterium]